MLHIRFEDMERIMEKDKITLHYFENSEYFIVITKSKIEKWEYYSVLYKSELKEFNNMNNVEQDLGIDMFKINYLTNALKLESCELDIQSQIEPVPNNENEETYIGKSQDIEPGEDIVEESESYDGLYVKIINKWEKDTLKMLNSELNKSLSDIKKKLNAIFNIKGFILHLPKIIRDTVKNGIKSAEIEGKVQVGYTPRFEKLVKTLENQQLTGYTLPDGKKWFGIKGATSEDEQKIYNIVSEGVKNKESYKDISKTITSQFDSIKKSRAEGIAITETTRMLNESKLQTWKEAKIKGFKGWESALLPTTGEIDRRLHYKYHVKGIPFDDYFIDDKTGKKFFNPPAHVRCRCINTIVFKKHPKH